MKLFRGLRLGMMAALGLLVACNSSNQAEPSDIGIHNHEYSIYSSNGICTHRYPSSKSIFVEGNEFSMVQVRDSRQILWEGYLGMKTDTLKMLSPTYLKKGCYQPVDFAVFPAHLGDTVTFLIEDKGCGEIPSLHFENPVETRCLLVNENLLEVTHTFRSIYFGKLYDFDEENYLVITSLISKRGSIHNMDTMIVGNPKMNSIWF